MWSGKRSPEVIVWRAGVIYWSGWRVIISYGTKLPSTSPLQSALTCCVVLSKMALKDLDFLFPELWRFAKFVWFKFLIYTEYQFYSKNIFEFYLTNCSQSWEKSRQERNIRSEQCPSYNQSTRPVRAEILVAARVCAEPLSHRDNIKAKACPTN
jgi:hypothetical protein